MNEWRYAVVLFGSEEGAADAGCGLSQCPMDCHLFETYEEAGEFMAQAPAWTNPHRLLLRFHPSGVDAPWLGMAHADD